MMVAGRSSNPLNSLEVKFTANEQTGWYLDRLIEMGLFGNTRNEAAKIALFDHCKLLVAEGKMQMAPPISGNAVTTLS
jgi:hypothetical protein